MSYAKAMKHSSNPRKNKCYQPVLGMPFEGLKEGEHIESYHSRAIRIATSYNIRVSDVYKGTEFKQISQEFKTEDEAIDFIRENDLESKHKYIRIYNNQDMHVSGW